MTECTTADLTVPIARRIVAGLVMGLPTRKPRWGCTCGCTGPDDPECARRITDHAELYRQKVGEQRRLEGRSLDDIAPGLLLCLQDGTPVAVAAELFGVTVQQAEAVLDLLPPDDRPAGDEG